MKTDPSTCLSRGVILFLPLLFLCNPAHGNLIHFATDLTGPGESPTNTSPGIGHADVFFDDVAQTMLVEVTFSDLLGTTTASHIHAATLVPNTGTAGVATETPFFEGFPIGVTAGTYSDKFDLTLASSFNPAYVTAHGGTLAGASLALEAALLGESGYLNIHTTKFPGGEIRGFLHNVPDSSSTALLLAVAFGGMAGFIRRRKLPA